jgi:hypothetical protein
LCSVAIEIGDAADADRLEHRERGDGAGAPDADLMSRRMVVCSSGGNL